MAPRGPASTDASRSREKRGQHASDAALAAPFGGGELFVALRPPGAASRCFSIDRSWSGKRSPAFPVDDESRAAGVHRRSTGIHTAVGCCGRRSRVLAPGDTAAGAEASGGGIFAPCFLIPTVGAFLGKFATMRNCTTAKWAWKDHDEAVSASCRPPENDNTFNKGHDDKPLILDADRLWRQVFVRGHPRSGPCLRQYVLTGNTGQGSALRRTLRLRP